MPKGSDKFMLGFDLGGTKMMATVFDAKWNAIGHRRRRTKASKGMKTGLDRINQSVEEALSQASAAAVYRGEAPHLKERAGTDIAKIRSSVLAAAIADGDDVIEKIVRDAAGWLGRGVGIVVNLMAPDIVVLGGGLVEAMPDIYLEAVKEKAEEHAMRVFLGKFEVTKTQLGDNATVLGAAAWADSVLHDKDKP